MKNSNYSIISSRWLVTAGKLASRCSTLPKILQLGIAISMMIILFIFAGVGVVYAEGPGSMGGNDAIAAPPAYDVETPEIIRPAEEGATVQSLRPTLEWTEISEADAYEVQLFTGTRRRGRLRLREYRTLTTEDPQFKFKGYLPGRVSYFFRVRALIDDAANSGWSSFASFRTPKLVPEFIVPSGRNYVYETMRPKVEWQAFSDAIAYEVQVYTGRMRRGRMRLNRKPFMTLTTEDTFYKFQQYLSARANYFLRIRAVGPNDTRTRWSDWVNFTVPNNSPKITSPQVNGYTFDTLRPTLEWTAVEEAVSYDVQVYTGRMIGRGRRARARLDRTPYLTFNTVNTSYTPPYPDDMLRNRQFWMRVRAVGPEGNKTGWSSFSTFKTPNEVPDVVSPSGEAGIQSLQPLIEWTAITEAQSYEVQIFSGQYKGRGRGRRIVYNRQPYQTFTTSGDETSYLLTQFLPGNAIFGVRVRAQGPNSWTDWSKVMPFTVPNIAPEIVMPSEDGMVVSNLHPTLEWTGVESAEGYEVQVMTGTYRGRGRRQRLVMDRDPFLTVPAEATQTTYEFSDFLPVNRNFWVRVRASGPNGSYTNWSRMVKFTTPDLRPEFIYPAENEQVIDSLRPMFEWTSIESIESYDVRLYTGYYKGRGKRRSLRLRSYTQFSSVESFYEMMEELPPNKTFWITARGNGGTFHTNWTKFIKFTTPDPPTTPELTAPEDNIVLELAPLPEFTWTESSNNPAYYRLEFYEPGNPRAVIHGVDVDGLAYLPGEDDVPGGTFEYHVRAHNASGAHSSWSEFQTITIDAPKPVSPVDGTVTTSYLPTLIWEPFSADTSLYQFQVCDTWDCRANILSSHITNQTSYTLSGEELPAGEFFWRVRATTARGTTPWSAPENFFTPAVITGTVRTAAEPFRPLDKAYVFVEDGSSFAITDSAGNYTLKGIQPGTWKIKAALSGYIPQGYFADIEGGEVNNHDFDLLTLPGIDEMKITLTWGSTPSDLDSHLLLPEDYRSHVDYIRVGSLEEHPYALLDMDKVRGSGPENITLTRPGVGLYEGTYTYAVYNYSQEGAFLGSNATVEIWKDGELLATFYVSGAENNGENWPWWHVCNFQVTQYDDHQEIEIIPVNALTSGYPGGY